jgi:hypothetical protein
MNAPRGIHSRLSYAHVVASIAVFRRGGAPPARLIAGTKATSGSSTTA